MPWPLRTIVRDLQRLMEGIRAAFEAALHAGPADCSTNVSSKAGLHHTITI